MKDGGPAFPRLERSKPDSLPVRGAPTNYVHRSVGGMTLRDYFAGQALVGIMTRNNFQVTPWAELAYKVADAMLKEREK